MKKPVFVTIIFAALLLLTIKTSAQTDLEKMAASQDVYLKRLDSAMNSNYFITIPDANKILERPSYLKDSAYKCSNGFLRYTFDYLATHIDSTSKGRIFFTFEQYKDDLFAGDIYKNIKTENEKSGGLTPINDIGDEGF